MTDPGQVRDWLDALAEEGPTADYASWVIARLAAADAAERDLAAAWDALAEAIPYVRRRANSVDPDNDQWVIETAEGVLARIQAALRRRDD